MTHADNASITPFDQLFQRWVDAELQSISFDVANEVMAEVMLDEPVGPVSSSHPADQVLQAYQQSVANQCPDLWPGIVQQLNKTGRRKRQVAFYRVAASLILLIGIGSLLWTKGLEPQPVKQSSLASLSTTPVPGSALSDSTASLQSLKPDQIAGVAPAASVKSVADEKAAPLHPMNVVHRFRVKTRSTLPHAEGVVKAVMSTTAKPITHARQIERAILAEAQNAVAQQQKQAMVMPSDTASAPGAYDYVINVSANSKDELVLGLSQ